jgi:hypothetical protein
MKLAGSVALVTGTDRGLGRHFATQLVHRDAAAVYAAARPGAGGVDVPGAIALALDDAEPDAIAAAAETIGEVTVLVNTADFPAAADPGAGHVDAVQRRIAASYSSLLNLIRSFAPTLESGAGGVIVNVLSTLASGGNAVPNALITAVLFGPERTDMIAEVDLSRNDQAAVVRAVLDGIEAGDAEIIPDILAAQAKANGAAGWTRAYRPLL